MIDYDRLFLLVSSDVTGEKNIIDYVKNAEQTSEGIKVTGKTWVLIYNTYTYDLISGAGYL